MLSNSFRGELFVCSLLNKKALEHKGIRALERIESDDIKGPSINPIFDDRDIKLKVFDHSRF